MLIYLFLVLFLILIITKYMKFTPFTSSTALYTNSVSISPGNTVTLNITTNAWASDYYALLLNYTGYHHSDILYKP